VVASTNTHKWQAIQATKRVTARRPTKPEG